MLLAICLYRTLIVLILWFVLMCICNVPIVFSAFFFSINSLQLKYIICFAFLFIEINLFVILCITIFIDYFLKICIYLYLSEFVVYVLRLCCTFAVKFLLPFMLFMLQTLIMTVHLIEIKWNSVYLGSRLCDGRLQRRIYFIFIKKLRSFF